MTESTNYAVRVENMKDGYRYKRTAAVFFAVGIVGMMLTGVFFASWVLALAAAFAMRGGGVLAPTPDPQVKWRVWGFPLRVRVIALVLCAVSAFMYAAAIMDASHKTLPPVWAFAVAPTIAAAVWTWLAVRDHADSRGVSLPALGRRRQVETEPMTEDDIVLGRFTDQTLRQAGLGIRLQTGGELVPQIVGRGFNARELPSVDVALIPGKQHADDYVRLAPNLASAWGVPSVDIEPRIEDGRHVVRIVAVTGEKPLSVDWMPNPDGPGMGIAEYVSTLPMGAYVATRDPWVMNLAERNFVISGIPGSGKSSFTNGFMAHLVLHPDQRIAVVDLKNGAESAKWEDLISLTIDNADSIEAGQRRTLDFITEANADMKARYARMRRAGVTNAWTEGFLGPDEPVKVLVIDESAQLFKRDTPEQNELANLIESGLGTFVSQGRAAGYVLIMSTQYPRNDFLPTAIRENVSDSIAFRQKSTRGVTATLGAEYYAPAGSLGDPTAISAKGQAVVVSGDDDGERIQMSWLSPEVFRQVANHASPGGRRPWLDEAPTEPVTVTVIDEDDDDEDADIVWDDEPKALPESKPAADPFGGWHV